MDKLLRRFIFTTVVLCSSASSVGAENGIGKEEGVPIVAATLVDQWWIDGSENLDISGLSFCDGVLVAVADKSSEQFYAFSPIAGTGSVQLEVKGSFTRPSLPDDQPVSVKARALHIASTPLSMDFEGITCDAGGVYLLSERHNRIVQIESGAGRWSPQRWSESARAHGYLQFFNGESEGLVKAGADFWVALERNPRGLLKLKPEDEEGREFFQLPPVTGLDFHGRSEDLTGLAYYDGALFTLERNAFAVCRRSIETLVAQWCIDYRHIEEAAENIYRETIYGKGEGLAVDASGIYVVLDNNGVDRLAAPGDARGLLMHLAFPEIGSENR
ncbi:hypothetical protein PVT68_18345 [Microbulbifer bruguierae]|uniref:Phytase-like domain-containing protein n=1 Tax=Microbulbifer bruguierae TaxID=3029061 RepID=A0ABY8NE32_9GAMM|nr:hypothetical protein [Microbulbifer bruguierae]WGL16699.1 hypothetical protein PVT68_18345 [Microbulbifer bruguierae]